MKRWLLLVTGSSRGLGAALVAKARAAGHTVIGVSRSGGSHALDVELDLGQPERIQDTLAPLLEAHISPECHQYALVNNAAMLGPVGVGYDAAGVSAHMALNLVAPIMLSRVFARTLAGTDAIKRIVSISSGASTRPIAGWSLYCASKAGLDHFARVMAEEQADCHRPVQLVNVSPGVIDTDMQAAIRTSSETDFPAVEQFRQMHASGALQSPDAVAAKLMAGLSSGRVFAGELLSIDDFARS
jgi:NAD(P)-dependent dehydrogenase (short-subunit alcohol dehydrogenase family)